MSRNKTRDGAPDGLERRSAPDPATVEALFGLMTGRQALSVDLWPTEADWESACLLFLMRDTRQRRIDDLYRSEQDHHEERT